MEFSPSPPRPDEGGHAAACLPGSATRGHVETFCEDLRLFVEADAAIQHEEWLHLAACNDAMLRKYQGLAARSATVASSVAASRAQLAALPDHLARFDELDRELDGLEAVTRQIDEYSAALERRFLNVRLQHQ